MGGTLRGKPGGILGLCWLLTEHGEAIEYDLITLGLRLANLGSPTLTWRDLLVITREAPPSSALRRAQTGGWGITEYLLAVVADELAIANWQRQGKRGAPRPKPIPRPGQTGEVFGSDPIPIAEFNSWWEEAA